MIKATHDFRRTECLSAGVLLLVGALGCYTTGPVPSAITPGETRITAQLTPAVGPQLEALIGQNAIAVEGIVAEVRDDEWDLRLVRVDYRNAASVYWNEERVVFPAGTLTAMRERRLDKPRTALVAGGITVGALLVARLAGAGGFLRGRDDDPPPTQ